jgi:ligand-binding sensor domain-containing protein
MILECKSSPFSCACWPRWQPCRARGRWTRTSLADYHHDIWTGKDGAPGEISAMAQTADGWLWIGSSHGLYRFDGVRFRASRRAGRGDAAPAGHGADRAAQRRPADRPYLRRRQHLSKGHLRHTPSMLGKVLMGAVYSMVRDQNGVLWASTTNGLLQLRDGAWRNVGQELGCRRGGLPT